MSEATIHTATPGELTLVTLHDILRLRVDVFVVEQNCPYPELDGRDLTPTTTHWWIGEPVTELQQTETPAGGDPGEAADEDAVPIESYVRVIDHSPTSAEPATRQLGRVVTHPTARGQGQAAAVIRAVLAAEPGAVMCEAQSYLREWYEGLGFTVIGEEFVEDGIPHYPMHHPNP